MGSKLLGVGFLLALVACGSSAPIGVETRELNRESANVCASQCGQIGLVLDSVVVMASRVGCVCRAMPPATPSSSAGGASAAGGVTAVMLDIEREEREEEERKQKEEEERKTKEDEDAQDKARNDT